MFEVLKMTRKCVLKDIKNYLKKLETGQLEIEAGQWELHKDILNMRSMFDELKVLKDDVEEMKRTNLEQMGIIRKLELALSQQKEIINKKKNLDTSAATYKNNEKRLAKNCNKLKDPKNKKTHLVQSEEIIEITSQLETHTSKSLSDCNTCTPEKRPPPQRERKRGTKLLANPIRSVLYFRKHGSKLRCLPIKKKDNAMLQRYLKDSVKYCEEKASDPDNDVFEEVKVCNDNNKNKEPGKSDSWNHFVKEPTTSNSRDSEKSTEGNTETNTDKSDDSLEPKTATHSSENKDIVVHPNFHERIRRKKNESSYVCGICKKSFHTKDLLRAHDVVHRKMSENPVSYKCDYCSNVYKTPETLEKHVRKCQFIRSLYRKN